MFYSTDPPSKKIGLLGFEESDKYLSMCGMQTYGAGFIYLSAAVTDTTVSIVR